MNKQYTDVMGRFVTNRALIEPFAVERKEVDGSIQYHLTLNDESVGCVSVGPATSGTISITWYEDGKTKGIEAGAGEAINKIPFNLPPPAGDLWRILKTYLRMNLASVPTPADEDEGREGGPTVRTQIRAEVFKGLKTEHPTWSQGTVAMKAQDKLGEIVTADTVRNTYRAMGWEWKRADRIR